MKNGGGRRGWQGWLRLALRGGRRGDRAGGPQRREEGDAIARAAAWAQLHRW